MSMDQNSIDAIGAAIARQDAYDLVNPTHLDIEEFDTGEMVRWHVDQLNRFVAATVSEGLRVGNGTLTIECDDAALLAFERVTPRLPAALVAAVVFHGTSQANEIYLKFAYVRPAYRRKGIYSEMWRRLLDVARANDIRQIASITSVQNKAVQAFSEKQGRRLVGYLYEYEVPR